MADVCIQRPDHAPPTAFPVPPRYHNQSIIVHSTHPRLLHSPYRDDGVREEVEQDLGRHDQHAVPVPLFDPGPAIPQVDSHLPDVAAHGEGQVQGEDLGVLQYQGHLRRQQYRPSIGRVRVGRGAQAMLEEQHRDEGLAGARLQVRNDLIVEGGKGPQWVALGATRQRLLYKMVELLTSSSYVTATPPFTLGRQIDSHSSPWPPQAARAGTPWASSLPRQVSLISLLQQQYGGALRQ